MKNYSTHVKSVLDNCIGEMTLNSWLYVKKPGVDFTRSRKMNFDDTMKFLISKQKNSTQEELLNFYNYNSETPTQSAFIQQRDKIRPDAFEFLFHEFTSSFSYNKTLKGYRLLACDGTSINITRNPDDESSYCLTDPYGKGFNQLLLNTVYDIYNKVYLDAIIQPYREMNERQAMCDMVDHYCQNNDDKVIFTADRGYESFNTIAHFIENNAKFVLRAKDLTGKTSMLSTLGLPEQDEFDVDVKRYLTRSTSAEVRSNPHIYKYIRNSPLDYMEKGKHALYYMAFRVVRFKVSDEDGESYQSIITNLPRYEFSASDIKEIYAKRWGIETSFRELKYDIGIINFHSKKLDFIFQEIFAKLTLYNFCLIITMHVEIAEKDTKYQYKVNISMAIPICIAFLLKSGNDPPMNVEKLIGRYIEPIRSGRNFPRYIRKRTPISFNYR